jgi:glycosyltransferase involved in cell wall biosynthesis
MVLHVVAVVESEEHVCCRYRIAAFRPHLEAAGHRLSVRDLSGGLLRRLRVLRSVRDADAVILQRKLLSRVEFAVLRRSARRLIFDFDDAVWLRDSFAAKGFDCPKRRRRFLRTVAGCDTVVAGNRYLARAVGTGPVRSPPPARDIGSPVPLPPRESRARGIAVVPTCVDPAGYPLADHTRTGAAVRLVWLGSSSTLQALERNRGLMDAVGEAVPGIRLTVICDRFPTFDKLPVDAVPWRADTEAADLAAADIGIGWIPDDPWSRGKCGLKLLQYHAAGLAVIANPVGVQGEIVRSHQTGFAAQTAAEWVAAVRALAADPALRLHFGRAGRHQAESAYSVAAGGAAWVRLLEGH